jgi:hypothetical protein
MGLIHTIGDSHAKLNFEGDTRFAVHHLGPLTMYRVGIDGEWLIGLKELGVKDLDWIVWCFGEIDVRNHIIKQRDGQNTTVEKIINPLADNYVQTIFNLAPNNSNMILAVIPPTDNSNDAGFPRVGLLYERVHARNKLNTALEKYADQWGLVCCDPWEPFTNQDGSLRADMSDGNVHVGPEYKNLVAGKVLGCMK